MCLNESSDGSDFIQRIVETYSDTVIRIAYQNTANRSDAEDIAQEVFIRFMREKAFNDEEHIKAWLIRVTINLCKDLKKSFWHRKTVPINETPHPFSDTHISVMEEIWKLPGNYRNTIYLYYYEGYTVPEIAEILRKKENTVSSWLTRARKKLKNIILDGGCKNE